MAFLANGDNYAAASLLANIASDLGLNVTTAALSVTAYMFSFGIFTLIFGPLSDRFGKVKVINTAGGVLNRPIVPIVYNPDSQPELYGHYAAQLMKKHGINCIFGCSHFLLETTYNAADCCHLISHQASCHAWSESINLCAKGIFKLSS